MGSGVSGIVGRTTHQLAHEWVISLGKVFSPRDGQMDCYSSLSFVNGITLLVLMTKFSSLMPLTRERDLALRTHVLIQDIMTVGHA